MVRAIPIGWPSVNGKSRSIFLGYFHWSLTGRFRTMENAHSFHHQWSSVVNLFILNLSILQGFIFRTNITAYLPVRESSAGT